MKNNWQTYLTIAIVIAIAINIVSTIPYKTFLNNKKEVVVKFLIGPSKIFSVDKIQISPLPQNVFGSITRTFGTGLGKIQSGQYYSKELKKNIYIYIYNKDDLKYFEYDNKWYITNSWDK